MRTPTRIGLGSATLDDASDGELRDLKWKAAVLAREPAVHFYELAESLIDLRNCHSGSIAGFTKLAGISRRKLYYLLAVGEFIVDWDISKTVAEEVGWTKLQIIARHIKRRGGKIAATEIVANLDLARVTSARALSEALTVGNVIPRRVVSFYLDERESDKLTKALLFFGAQRDHRGLLGKETALARMIKAAGT